MAEFQNAKYGIFPGVGEYEIPEIMPVYDLPEVHRHIAFDFAHKVRNNHQEQAVHFFRYDYLFERVWNFPDQYAPMLKRFAYVIGPDFSIYADFPKALQVYNLYRNNWLVRYWQNNYEMKIIPTVLWGEEKTFSWCFDGIPHNSIVAISDVGLNNDDRSKKLFRDGYDAMLDTIHPSKIVFHTSTRKELPGNVPIEYMRWKRYTAFQNEGF